MQKISAIINDLCKKFNIKYHSEKGDHWNDSVEKLADIYLELKVIIGTLKDIEEKHKDINGVVETFEDAIKHLEDIDHELIKEAKKIADKKLCEN